MTIARQILLTVVALALTLILFESTPLDPWVQDWLYSESEHAWLWSGSEPVSRLLLYDAIRASLYLFGFLLLTALLLGRRVSRLRPRLAGIRIVLASLIAVPATVGALKSATNVACPYKLQQFGGDLPYVRVLERYPPGSRPEKPQRCFPAGHASGGFALLSLFFLFDERRSRRRALFFALALGWLMGGYKMLIGDHFLSHTVITMELAWLLVCLIAWLDKAARKLFGRAPLHARPEDV